jgi:hypothetical protein
MRQLSGNEFRQSMMDLAACLHGLTPDAKRIIVNQLIQELDLLSVISINTIAVRSLCLNEALQALPKIEAIGRAVDSLVQARVELLTPLLFEAAPPRQDDVASL